MTKVDRNLFVVRGPGSELLDNTRHFTIHLPSMWMVNRYGRNRFKRAGRCPEPRPAHSRAKPEFPGAESRERVSPRSRSESSNPSRPAAGQLRLAAGLSAHEPAPALF